MPIANAKAELDKGIDGIQDAKNLTRALRGLPSGSLNALTRLCARDEHCIVSDYATKRLADKIEQCQVDERIGIGDVVFEGCQFELEVVKRLLAKTIPIISEHPWNSYANMAYFDDNEDPSLCSVTDNTLLIPYGYYQHCFDLLLYVRKGHLRFGLITAAKMHLFKLEAIAPLAEMFKDADGNCVIEFDIIISLCHRNYYKVSLQHFHDKHLLAAYDPKWKSSSAQISGICKVLLMDRYSRTSASTFANNYPPFDLVEHDEAGYNGRRYFFRKRNHTEEESAVEIAFDKAELEVDIF